MRTTGKKFQQSALTETTLVQTCRTVRAACFVISVLVIPSCNTPGMQEDVSQFGSSPIAQRVLPESYSDRGDQTDRELEVWVSEHCKINNPESARACGLQIGMSCNDASDPKVECVFIGIRRSRPVQFAISSSRPSIVGPWSSGQAVVVLRFSAPGPFSIDYTAGPIAEEATK
jgi:hypothetical protein